MWNVGYSELRLSIESVASLMQLVSSPAHEGLPAKKYRLSLFSHYEMDCSIFGQLEPSPAQLLTQYVEHINVSDTNPSAVYANGNCKPLHPKFERIICVPASSVPAERVFLHCGLVMKLNRTKMSDTLLEELVFLKCNYVFKLKKNFLTLQ